MRTSCLILALSAQPAVAFSGAPDQQLRFFATCAGRLSALMEHQWTYDTAAVDQTTAFRAAMIELVSAVMPDGMGRAVLLHQVEAKHALARLLQRAEINKDPADAQWAQQRADALTSECTAILTVQSTS